MELHTYGKFISISLAAALAVTAAAAQAEDNIKVYGKARASVDITDNGTASASNVSSNSSRLGFKGVEDLGNGLKAVFQMETLVTMDGSDSLLLGTPRNSYLGLAGGFGTLVLGVTDNAYKLATGKLDIWSDSMGDFNAIIGNVSGASTPFNEREPSSINYWSPKMNGFQFLAAYRVDEDAANNRDRYSLAGVYENGPLYASLAYEQHRKEATLSGSIYSSTTPPTGAHIYDTHAWTLSLGYTFNHDNTKINFVYEDLSQDGAATLMDRNAWYLGLAHKMAANTLKIAYARAGDNDTGGDTGADWYVLGLDHALSKRTSVYALYARTDNESGAKYGLGTGGSSGAVKNSTNGLDLSTFSVGINHDF
ncbi:MAG: porin [Gammaproteobacteria bacterium]|nr:porin [Gammaproteobacteria bacterium]